MIVLLCGKSGSGKSTIAREISKRYDIPIRSFATKPKQIAQQIYGFPPGMIDGITPESRKWRECPLATSLARGRTPRELVIELAEPLRVSSNLWARLLVEEVRGLSHKGGVVIDDLRFPEEHEAMVAAFGKLVKVVYIPGGGTDYIDNHASELSHKNITPDYVYSNNISLYVFLSKHGLDW